MRGVKVFLGLLVFRILSVFIVQSWYVPDEYWQSLEVSHKLAFGWVNFYFLISHPFSIQRLHRYGYLTWEWTKGIRSYIHPVIIAGIYKALEALGLDDVQYLVIAPRIFQAILTAFADYRFFKWSNQSKWSLFMIVTSWFWFYTGSRTLANTVEAALTSIALSYFPWRKGKHEWRKRKFLDSDNGICRIVNVPVVRCTGMLHSTNRCDNMVAIVFPSHQIVPFISRAKCFPKISSHWTDCWWHIGWNRLSGSW